MKLKRRIGWALLFTVLLLFTLAGCGKYYTPKAAEDEILLKIQLDIKEDIGLLIVDYESNGDGGSGGTSNANKTPIKHDELIYYTIEKRSFDNPSEVKELSLNFRIITEYIDPNYDNIYPEQYTRLLSEISLDVNFGEAYSVTITGDNTNGYTAMVNE